MALSGAEVRLIADLVRSASKAPSVESMVSETFRTLKAIASIASLRLVYASGPPGWNEWRTSGKRPALVRSDEWPEPANTAMTVRFDPGAEQSGYISVTPKGDKAALALETLAPPLWTALLLQSALERVKSTSKLETDIFRATLRARDEERRRIARELHDDLGQSMAALRLNLKWAEDIVRQSDGMEEVVQELSSSRDSVSGMLGKIRDLSHTLYPRILDTLGLTSAIKELTLQIARHSTFELECTVDGHERAVDKETGVALYRCCQESISNAVRHAHASRLMIKIHYAEKEVHLTVEDNGRGFNPRTLYDASGRMMTSGFWTIRQRMADLNGAFRLSTAEGKGTVLEMIVPYSTKRAHAKRKDKTAHSG